MCDCSPECICAWRLRTLRASDETNSGLQDMNFKVDPHFHTVFKTSASVSGLSMKELLEASFRAWVEKYGDEATMALIRALFPNFLHPQT